MPVFGVTGHQSLSPATAQAVSRAMEEQLCDVDPLIGATSLAEGADQVFAEVVLRNGGRLVAVIPSANYVRSFANEQSRSRYRQLLSVASEHIQLPFAEPSEDAYMAAGMEVVDRSDTLLAVWDGKPAAGRGGTANVVEYAMRRGTRIVRIWPPGASR